MNRNHIIAFCVQEGQKLLSSVELYPPFFDDEDENEVIIRNAAAVRIKNYVEKVIPAYSRKQFQSHFRISRETYDYLLPAIHSLIQKKSNVGRCMIDIEKQLLSVLWILATPDSYRSISERFDIAKSSLSVSFVRIINVLCDMAPHVIMWPQANNIDSVKRNFYHIAGIDGIIGSVDGTFITMKAPKIDPTVYVTRKCNYALTLQAICDSSLKFTDCYVGYPGSVSDTRIFRNSDVYNDITANTNHFFPNGEFIVGDKAYPVLSWCIPPYIDRGNLNEAERNFNLRISQSRQVIERAFALLFGRFRRLRFLDMNRFDLIPKAVMAACVLHNICLNGVEPHIDEYVREGIQNVYGNDIVELNHMHQDFPQNGNNKREALCRRLFEVLD